MIDPTKELYHAEQSIQEAITYLDRANLVEPEAKELYYIACALFNIVQNLRCGIRGNE